MPTDPLPAAVRELAGELARLVDRSSKIVAFTGAGISTESGIPDFRSPGGVWSRYQPVMYQDFLTSPDARKRYWQMQRESYPVIVAAQPNAAHLALAELERLGKLDWIITQNIDGLHQKAGSSAKKVIELHGNCHTVVCLYCERRYPRAEIQAEVEAGVDVPLCVACNGALKPATVSFGQSMPVAEMLQAERAARDCDLMLVIGSTLIVYPAAQIPVEAMEAGAKLAIVNLSETPLDHHADVLINASAGVVMRIALELFSSRSERH
ncbi:MAG: Sir2 family NAD-dependent protein deacetylase [Chloroflexi bacterium]|nr:Sir2 family NAD-dependent protein deacetylase [Chloroflexota bacterium]